MSIQVKKVKLSHRKIYTDILIDAPANHVWEVLKDTKSYKKWAAFLVEIEGELINGDEIQAKFQLDPQKEKYNSIKHIIQGREDKLVALNNLLAECQLGLGEAAYMGDDLPDLAAVISCEFGITVPNACYQLRESADWTTTAPGGKGAVREAAELILNAQNKLQSALQAFYPS